MATAYRQNARRRVTTIFVFVPVIVVGADTDVGKAIADRLHQPKREVRVFVTDPEVGLSLRRDGFKVALGDVSDASHVEAAATRCFTAVLIAEASGDARERSFASTPAQVLRGWADAVARSGVTRVIWVTASEHPETRAKEVAVVDPAQPEVATLVFELDDARSLG